MKKAILSLSLLLLLVLTGCNFSSAQDKEHHFELGKKENLLSDQKVENYISNNENDIEIDEVFKNEKSDLNNNSINEDNIIQINSILNYENEDFKDSIMKMSIEELNNFCSQYNYFILCGYYFINYNDDVNIVVKIDKTNYREVEEVNIFYKVQYSNDVISKIQIGMSIEEVVEMVGNPIGSFTSGILSVDFKIDKDIIIRTQVSEDFKVISVKEILINK